MRPAGAAGFGSGRLPRSGHHGRRGERGERGRGRERRQERETSTGLAADGAGPAPSSPALPSLRSPSRAISTACGPFCPIATCCWSRPRSRSTAGAGGRRVGRRRTGAHLVFVQTHADLEADIRDDWRRVLARAVLASRWLGSGQWRKPQAMAPANSDPLPHPPPPVPRPLPAFSASIRCVHWPTPGRLAAARRFRRAARPAHPADGRRGGQPHSPGELSGPGGRHAGRLPRSPRRSACRRCWKRNWPSTAARPAGPAARRDHADRAAGQPAAMGEPALGSGRFALGAQPFLAGAADLPGARGAGGRGTAVSRPHAGPGRAVGRAAGRADLEGSAREAAGRPRARPRGRCRLGPGRAPQGGHHRQRLWRGGRTWIAGPSGGSGRRRIGNGCRRFRRPRVGRPRLADRPAGQAAHRLVYPLPL